MTSFFGAVPSSDILYPSALCGASIHVELLEKQTYLITAESQPL
jgi:hypothetical protein